MTALGRSFDHTSEGQVLLPWRWSGAGALEKAGYAIPDPGDTFEG